MQCALFAIMVEFIIASVLFEPRVLGEQECILRFIEGFMFSNLSGRATEARGGKLPAMVPPG